MTEKVLVGEPPPAVDEAVSVFRRHGDALAGAEVKRVYRDVLAVVGPELKSLGWTCADGLRSKQGVVLLAGPPEIRADGFHEESRTGLWIETDRAWTNNAVLRDVIDAGLGPDVDHVVVAIQRHAFERCLGYLQLLVASQDLSLPLRSLTLYSF